MSKLVIQEWVISLNYNEQAKVLSMLRDCDINNDKLNMVNKMLRLLIVKKYRGQQQDNLDNSTVLLTEHVADIIMSIGRIESENWYKHIMEVILIIQKKHPNEYVRHYWEAVSNTLEHFDTCRDWKLRLIKERDELDTRYNKLITWLANDKNIEDLTEEAHSLLCAQRDTVEQLLLILNSRLEVDDEITIQNVTDEIATNFLTAMGTF